LEQIDLDSIQLCDTTFINEELEEIFADTIFSFEYKDKRKRKRKEKMLIAILLEHKSRPYKYTPVQVAHYLTNIYINQIKNGQALQFVLPLVYYHGKEKWIYSPLSDLFEDIPEYFRKFIPTHHTEFIDLYRQTDEELLMLSNFLLSSALLTQKYSREPNALFEKINLIFGSINEVRDKNLIQAIVVYYIHLIQEKDFDLTKNIKPLPPPVKNIIMSTYDMILEKGIEKGTEKIIISGYQNGASLEFLAKISGLQIDQIQAILTKNGIDLEKDNS